MKTSFDKDIKEIIDRLHIAVIIDLISMQILINKIIMNSFKTCTTIQIRSV